VLTLLLFLFDPAGLAAPRWDVREAATARLARWWPLSEPALRAAEGSSDPEARERAGRAREAGGRRAFGPGWRVRWDAVALVLDPHETGGLPWASPGMHRSGAWRAELRSELASLAAYAGWFPPGTRFAFDPSEFAGRPDFRWDMLVGLDDIRFAARGIDPPTDWWRSAWDADPIGDARRAWEARKKTGRPLVVPPAAK
jgi:hypothetical protein